MPIFIWKIYWKLFLGKNDEAVIFGKLIITKGRLVCDTTFSYTYSKRTKQANLDSQIAGAKTLVEEKLEKPQLLLFISHRYRRNGLAQ
jgi:hypothetical protein